ncbi:MAG: hypothetical protein ACK4TA_11430 [Saprospiraceae bacterium]
MSAVKGSGALGIGVFRKKISWNCCLLLLQEDVERLLTTRMRTPYNPYNE